jgi:hypothetical protein
VCNPRAAVQVALLLQFVPQDVLTAATLVKADGVIAGTQVFTLRKVNTLFRILLTFTINILKLRK